MKTRTIRATTQVPDLLTLKEVAWMIGIHPATATKRYQRGRFPQPDYQSTGQGHGPLWKRSTIIDYYYEDKTAYLHQPKWLVDQMMADTEYINQCRKGEQTHDRP